VRTGEWFFQRIYWLTVLHPVYGALPGGLNLARFVHLKFPISIGTLQIFSRRASGEIEVAKGFRQKLC
jgi:hypothetical protein